jgi:hypothetical protein
MIIVVAVITTIATAFLSFLIDLEGRPPLQVSKNLWAIYVVNIGNGPIKILDFVINGDRDCNYIFSNGIDKLPVTVKVGGGTGISSTACNAVRVTIKTDQGTDTYSFIR